MIHFLYLYLYSVGGGGLFCLLFVMFVMLGHNNRIKHFNYIKRPDGQSASKINVTELHCG